MSGAVTKIPVECLMVTGPVGQRFTRTSRTGELSMGHLGIENRLGSGSPSKSVKLCKLLPTTVSDTAQNSNRNNVARASSDLPFDARQQFEIHADHEELSSAGFKSPKRHSYQARTNVTLPTDHGKSEVLLRLRGCI
jgi:hypothetical protein